MDCDESCAEGECNPRPIADSQHRVIGHKLRIADYEGCCAHEEEDSDDDEQATFAADIPLVLYLRLGPSRLHRLSDEG
jgi:hypothetical protein